MVSPHLLTPFSSRQLGLVHGDGRVIVFAVLGGRYSGPTVLVHAPTLARRIDHLPRSIDVVALVDDPVPDAATVSLVDDMVAELLDRDVEALVRHAAATEAVKRVVGDRVQEGIDRSALFSVRSPEVFRAAALRAAVESLGDEQWVSVSSLVARTGGRIAVHGLPLQSVARS